MSETSAAVVKKVVIIDWHKLPRNVKEEISESHSFGNDRYLRHYSELDTGSTMEDVVDYHKEQVETNEYKGSLEDFIRDYGLELDVWLMSQHIDMTGIDDILIEVFC